MAYTPTVWKDRDVENPRTYTARQNEDGSITFFDAPGEIREQGTPVNASNMNKIEEQLYKNDLEAVKIGDTQTISGQKNFTSNIESHKNGVALAIKNPNLTFGEVPSTECYNSITFEDKRGNAAGILDHANAANGNDFNRWLLRYSVDGVTKQTGIENLKTASDNKTTLKFTTDYMDFSYPYINNGSMKVRNPATSFAKNKTGQCYINFWTGDNLQTGFINSFVQNGHSTTNITACYPKNDGTSNAYRSGLTVRCNPDGKGYAFLDYAPDAGANNNHIPTTAWVRKKAFPNYASGVAISSGITAPSDGLIVLFEKSQSGFLNGSFTVNSVKVCEWNTLDGGRSSLTFVVQKGDLIKFTNATATLFPLS
jgi:hypothetical protein